MAGRRTAAKRATARAPVTLRDVARVSGTTPMTVSNVINGRAGQVGAKLAARVLAACKRLDYRPHSSARRLRTNRRMTIGVIIVDPSPHYLSDPFTAAMLAGLNDVFRAAGYSILLQGAAPGDLSSVPLLQRIESDGICLVASGRAAVRRKIATEVAASGQPVVLIQDLLPGSVRDGCSLIQDDFGGAATLAAYCLAAPCRHAVMLTPSVAWPAMERRELGVRSALRSLNDIPEFHIVCCGDESYAETQAAFARHVASFGDPDLVIGGNDRMAIAAMKWLIERGKEIPRDVRVTGFNAFEASRFASPELTSVRSPAFRLGEESASAMLGRLDTGVFSFRKRVLPVEFVPNASTALRPSGAERPAVALNDNKHSSYGKGKSQRKR